MTSAEPEPSAQSPRPRPSSSLSPRARRVLAVWVVLLAGLTIWRLGFAPAPNAIWELTGQTMGTTWSVKVDAPDSTTADRAALARAIEARLASVNAMMSNWDPDSEISRFNAHASRAPFAVSPPLVEVMALAREVSALSGGAFDVTVAPLVRAWGFGPGDRLAEAPDPPDAPDPGELAALRARVGWERIEVDRLAGALRKSEPALSADLSAIAKGHGVDALADAVSALGYRNHLVEIGGELRAGGTRPDGRPWRVAIEEPDAQVRTVWKAVELRDAAMATSGDYRNYYELEGRRISHTIDPRSARPIEHTLASVSVVAPSAARADALATALNVVGPEEGRALAERERIAAYFIVREGRGSGFRSFESTAFAALH